MNCIGNASEICGGLNSNSVYSTQCPQSKILNQVIVGCYANSFSQNQLTEFNQTMATSVNAGTLGASYYVYKPSTMTISYCISICHLFNFNYAGLFAG